METFYTEFIAGDKSIMVPALQRDYVQASNDNLSEGIIYKLIHDLYEASCGKRIIDLNYIYGYNEDGFFIPIDGQQRLTTLWLFYLYIYALCPNATKIPLLEYRTREFARDFFSYLQKPGVLSDIIKRAKNNKLSIKDEIINNSPWFSSSWKTDISVESALNALSIIEDYYPKAVRAEDLRTNLEQTSSIVFTYMEMEGINSDLYIKMNGRGRPLSEFEKIKSWLDKIVSEKEDPNPVLSDIKDEWKYKFDNDWQDFFWENRNREQEHQEEIDDEELRMFYNLLYLYWIRKSKGLKLVEDQTSEGVECRKELARLLNIDDPAKIETHLLSKISSNQNFSVPIYVLQKTNLVDKSFLRWYYNAMNGIVSLGKEINSLAENPKVGKCTLEIDDEHTMIYRLFMDDAPNFKLCLDYAIIVYCTNAGDMAFDAWMRIWKNLTINSLPSGDAFVNALKTIDHYAGKDLLGIMQSGDNFEASGFYGVQKNEEIKKARLIKDCEWADQIYDAENFYIFRGAIRGLFECIDIDAKENMSDFVTRKEKAKSYFTRVESNPLYHSDNNTFKTKLICALVSQCDWNQLWHVKICRSIEDWRANITNNDLHSAVISLWDMPSIKDDGRENASRVKYENVKQKRVFDALCYTELIKEAIKANDNTVTLRCIDQDGHRYFIMSYNAKADWKKYFVGSERNEILDSLLKRNVISMVKDDIRKICDTPYFWGYHIPFNCKGHLFQWTVSDKLIEYLGDDKWSPALISGPQEIQSYIENLK